MAKQKEKWPILSLCCVLACLLVWHYGMMQLDRLESDSTAIGIRYAEPSVTQQALNALRTSIAEDDATVADWVAWKEDGTQTLRDDVSGRSDDAKKIVIYGDGTLLYHPSRFLSGNPPVKNDERSVAISVALARSIFGTTELLGQPIYSSEEEWTISGVFDDGEDKTALMQHPKNDGQYVFAAMEITPLPNESGVMDTAKEQVDAFSTKTQLGTNAIALDYSSTTAMLRLLGALPCLVIATIVLFRVAQTMSTARNWAARAMYGAFIIGVVLIAVWALHGWIFWPQYWLPSRWSYFEFWGERWQQFSDQWTAIFSLPSYSPDLARRKVEIGTLVCFVVALFLTFPGASFRKGTAERYAICAFVSMLVCFGMGMATRTPTARPLWLAWLLFFGASALLYLLNQPKKVHHEVVIDVHDAEPEEYALEQAPAREPAFRTKKSQDIVRAEARKRVRLEREVDE